MNNNKPQTNFIIRKAEIADARAIHEAHMKSIREICSNDHTAEEINAWGNRPFLEDQRIDAISNHFVFVVVIENNIEGFLHFNLLDTKIEAYVYALYLTKKANGFGVGKEMMKILFETCKTLLVSKINLHSTITAHSFYLKMGFTDSGPMTTVLVNQTPVRCTPMEKFL